MLVRLGLGMQNIFKIMNGVIPKEEEYKSKHKVLKKRATDSYANFLQFYR